MPSRILVRGPRLDVHIDAVRWALGRRGAPCVFWPVGEFPAEHCLSIDVDPTRGRDLVVGGETAGDRIDDIGVVWNRRRGLVALAEDLPSDEHDFARRESSTFLDAFERQIPGDAFWVNPVAAQKRDLDKPFQLMTARESGFTIPPTLFSNDPDEIAAFVERHDGEIVYKPFGPGRWPLENGGLALSYTTPVPRELLGDRAGLASAPGIYQKKLPKRDEWRLTVFGHTCFGARLDSQSQEESAIDWRRGQQQIPIEAVEVPEELELACYRYMDIAGLVFATFDFVRTPDDEMIFLEANQSGQFLWKEVQIPEMPLLAAFTEFLLAADPKYRWEGRQRRPAFADYEESDAFAALLERMGAPEGRGSAAETGEMPAGPDNSAG